VPVLDPHGAFPVPLFGALLAYGPAPGVELIPYFLALLGWAGLALSAVLLSPIAALIRRLRGIRGATPPAPTQDPLPPSAPEASGDASHGNA